VRVAVVDDHPVFRNGLKALLGEQHDFEVVGEGGDAPDAYALADSMRPDVMVLDVNLPGANGIDAAREIKRRAPSTRILMLSMYNDAGRVASALAAGASGYALKGDSPMVVLDAVRAVGRGERWVPPSMGTALDHRVGDGPLGSLSQREREVFNLLVRGFSNRSAANELSISVKTVETHRTAIHRKLGVHSVAQLMRYAAINNLIER
jgi:DNA-binding NarL/FixJ family response regulator